MVEGTVRGGGNSRLIHTCCRLHTGLQTKRRPLEVRVATMKASLNEYTEKLKQQENKVKVSVP